MKKIMILLIACIGLTTINADAQGKKKAKQRTVKVTKVKTLKPVTIVGTNKSTSDNTTGVMGKEPIRDNAKGRYKNMNTNNGVEVPPSDGGNNK